MSKPKVMELWGVRQGKASLSTRFADGWLLHQSWRFFPPDISHEIALFATCGGAEAECEKDRGERVAVWGKAVITKTAKG